MKKTITTILLILISFIAYAQSIGEPFSQQKMKKDFEVFKKIRLQANSGLYKYRTKAQIDSIYLWAENEIQNSSTYLDFYNIISKLTDFEGSLHNNTSLPKKYRENLRAETTGYFPYPIKWINGKWLVNYKNGDLPLGAELIAINSQPFSEVVDNLYKYYPTDGYNFTGKRIGLRSHFSKYYRLHYGPKDYFEVIYKRANSDSTETKIIKSSSYLEYYENFRALYSKPLDLVYYVDLKEDQKYGFKKIDSLTGVLTIHSFSMGNENSTEHKNYVAFLDNVFTRIKSDKLENLIVDVRQNGGGDDPNDLITYSYLTAREFQENKQAWISFRKIPLIRYYDIWIPKFMRFLVVGKYNKELQEIFPLEINGKYYQDENSNDQKVRSPNDNAFTGNVYLLVSPAVASAGSVFAAMLAGNENTITIGVETMGGYYGHNGHTPFSYVLPKSKLNIQFSIVNLEQDVPKRSNQIYGRGVIPDIVIHQTIEDFLNQEDTQLNFTLETIKRE